MIGALQIGGPQIGALSGRLLFNDLQLKMIKRDMCVDGVSLLNLFTIGQRAFLRSLGLRQVTKKEPVTRKIM